MSPTIDLDAARARVAELVKVDLLTKTQEADNVAYAKTISRAFVSDTITVPTKEMYAYAVQSTLGDDVYSEPSTIALEAHIAKLTGKEAGVFMTSGTMSNQIALRTHLKQPPYSILCDNRAHINKYEAGGAAFHSGAAVTTVIPSNGHHLTLPDVKANIILGSDIHSAPTEIVALENTLNGTIFPQEDIVAIADFVHSHGLKMHLDGARLWHVAAETATQMDVLCAPFDSVSLCLSKGLGAPIGTVLVGNKEYIAKARWFRKLFGGGMRQTGILAAAAAYALTHNFPLLPKVHALARKLEVGLEEIGAKITCRAETCMVFYDPSPLGLDYAHIGDRASELPEPITLGGSRLVVHIQTTEAAVDDFLALIRVLAAEKIQEGFDPSAPLQSKTTDIYVRRTAKGSIP